jgi:lipopolysaccharide/colanic/teichoic acid biosynthesis glycosyltransferase
VDLTVAVPAALLATPLMGAIALWIRRDSPGPVVFRQTRAGFAGRPFTLCKFRTMVPDAERMEGGLRTSARDPRITRSGAVLRRTSLDELPQLWNVIRGDMSLVGPRPTVPSQLERYTPRQRGRLLARPGLTGLAQVRGRNAIPWSQRIEIDLEYVARQRFLLDVEIMLRTVAVVLGRSGTYTGEEGGFDLPAPTSREGAHG